MDSQELQSWGIPRGAPLKEAFKIISALIADGKAPEEIRGNIQAVIGQPEAFTDDQNCSKLAEMLSSGRFVPRATHAPYKQWGQDLEVESIQQMVNACQLPISVAGALMPDAHLGYGLPIGGVLATDNAVIPYAVGVDIACRMKMTVLDIPVADLDSDEREERLIKAIHTETRFGTGVTFTNRGDRKRKHAVLDMDWDVSPITKRLKNKAWAQLGTSGSGNHFVEFGVLEINSNELALPPDKYLALLSHSGSRGTGASVAAHYSKLAQKAHPELPDKLKHLAWLDMDSEEGLEYWAAMNLMGEYAAANHACIHHHIACHLGVDVLLDIENHHNFAWKERHMGRDLIVHRKGATPAGKGALGIIPGSMATPAYVVSGKGQPESLNSASHGAGRVMSRTKAKKTLDWKEANAFIKQKKVKLLSAGLDEVPMVYKNIDSVMDAQSDLVEKLAKFHPRIVKMAPAGERPED